MVLPELPLRAVTEETVPQAVVPPMAVCREAIPVTPVSRMAMPAMRVLQGIKQVTPGTMVLRITPTRFRANRAVRRRMARLRPMEAIRVVVTREPPRPTMGTVVPVTLAVGTPRAILGEAGAGMGDCPRRC